MPALQGGIAIDVDYVDGRQAEGTAEKAQLVQHLIAQLAVLTVYDSKTFGTQWRGPACTELAMNRTV
jgi:hypothetical protein